MSHSVDLQSLLEDLLLLEHVALGSQEFCSRNGFASFAETGYLQPLSPRTLLKVLVCEKLIGIAVKGRILFDHVDASEKGACKRLDLLARTGLRISYNTAGQKDLSIRDTFDKIIHALQVSISYAEGETESSNTFAWDGQVRLDGRRGTESWSHQICLAEWSRAVRRVVMQLIRDRRLEMLGWDGGF